MRIDQLEAGDKFKFGNGEVCIFIALDEDGDAWYVKLHGSYRHTTSCIDPDTQVNPVPKTPSYIERQAQWVKQHGITAGSLVKVTRAFSDGEQGFSVPWVLGMDKHIGAVIPVQRVYPDCVLTKEAYFPYFVLEPVVQRDPPKDTEALKPDDTITSEDCLQFCDGYNMRVGDDSTGKSGKNLVGMTVKEAMIDVPKLACVYRRLAKVPDGHYKLGPDDVVQCGDLFLSPHGPWWGKTSDAAGKTVREALAWMPDTYVAFARRKPSEYVPYSFKDMLGGITVVHKASGDRALILSQTTASVRVDRFGWFNYEELLDSFTHPNNEPCGKLQ